jgi:hypothetical protein
MNKFSRRVLLSGTCLTALLLGGTASAQGRRGGGDPEQMADRQVAMLKEAVSLTADQETQVRPILLDQIKKLREIMANAQGDRAKARGETQKLMADTREKLAKVLDAGQMEKYDKWVQERRSRGGGRRQQ